MARCLQSDVAGSIRNLARLSIIPGGWNGLGQLVHCVRTGETAFVKTFGLTNPFDYFKSHPEERAIFNAAMTDLALMSAPALAQAYDFGRFRRLVDVGGGQGSMLATILQRYPEVTAVLFDLPTVVERARPLLASSGVADRCEVVSGDFFQSVPHGGDGYIMRHIIHDWDDERSIHILRNTRHAIDPLGRLLLVDSVIASGNSPSPAKLVDLEMMALTGGCERTEAEFRELLAATGFRLLSVHPGTGGDGDQIMEAAPVLA